MRTRLPYHMPASIVVALTLWTGSSLRAQAPFPPVPPLLQSGEAEVVESESGTTIARTREDFASLGLTGSDLIALPLIPGGHEENKDFVRDLVRVQWRSNDPIDLYIIRPTGVKQPPPVVLFLLSFPTDSDRFLSFGFCRRLTQGGVAAVGFTSALTGQRYAHRPMKQWFISELPESLASTAHDVQMILNYLDARHDLDMSRVGIFGQGSGGAIAVLAAAADPRIKALDLLEPWGDWPNFLTETKIIPEEERQDYLKPEFLKKLEPLEPARYLPQLKGRSIRIQFVDDKPLSKPAKRIEQAALPDAVIENYGSQEELRTASGGRLFDWVGDQLKPAQAQDSSAGDARPTTLEKIGASR